MKQQILIVEDNEINREMLGAILSDDYNVLEAENGQAALDILESDKENIALILLDVMMPVMDGYTFLNIIKTDPVLSLIPVIVATQRDRLKAIKCDYAQGYFYAKPSPSAEYEKLLQRVPLILNTL